MAVEMSEADATVFVPGLGFRSSRGVCLAEPLTLTKDEDHALRIMSLLSTDAGTEIAFELRDKELQQQAFTVPTDPRWMGAANVRLRVASGAAMGELPADRGPGSISIGQHDFGFLGRRLVFEPIPLGVRSVTVELRGGLGDWDVPLELVPIGDTDVAPVTPIGAEQQRNGVTVRVRAIATSDTATYLEIEMTATSPAGSVLSTRPFRLGADRFAILDERGERLDEVISRDAPRGGPHAVGRAVATFPPLPADAKSLTLLVPAVVVQETEGSVNIELPVHAPTEMSFGPYRMTISWADVVDDLRPAPGEPLTRGVEVRFKTGAWQNDRQVLRPGAILADGARCWNFGFDHANPEALRLNVPLRDRATAKTITFLDPVVRVRGPWEIPWRR